MSKAPQLTAAEMTAFLAKVKNVESNGGIPDEYTCPAINAALKSRCILNFEISRCEGAVFMNALNQVYDYNTKARPLTADDLEVIIPTLGGQDIHTLDMRENGLTNDTLLTLLRLLPKTITTLILKDNNFTPDAEKALREYGLNNHCKITATIKTPDASQKSGYKSANFDFNPAYHQPKESAAAASADPDAYDNNHDDSAAASHREILGAPGGPAFEDCDLT